MTPQDRDLIGTLFDRLNSVSNTPKDREADAFIRDCLRQFPDAPYFLVQTALVQQQGLEEAERRISELEASVRQGSATNGGSFLGGSRFANPSSRAAPAYDRDPEPAARGPWAQQSAPQRDTGSGGGGFLSSALSTASGVAGGMFLAEGIRSLFGGGSSIWGGSERSASDQAALDRAQDQAQDAEIDAADARTQLAADDQALDDMQDAQQDYDTGGGWSDDGSTDV